MRVETHQPVEIETRRAASDAIEAEPGDRPIAVDDLIVAVTPAEAQQPVYQRIRKNPEFAVRIDAQRAMPFGELGPVGAVDQGNMRVDRRLPAECTEQLGLAKRVVEVIVAPDRMGDFHVVIVDDDRQHVGRRSVAPQKHHVVELGVGDPDHPLHHILDDGFAFARRLESDDGIDARRGFRGIAVAPPPVIEHPAPLGLGPLTHFRELVGCGITAIGLSFIEQAARRLSVARETRELAHRLIVPVKPEPRKAVENRGDRVVGGAAPVGILDPQQEPASVVPGEQPIEQRRPRAADVEKSRRRRGEAGDDRHGGSSEVRLIRAGRRRARRRSALTR